MALPVTAPEVQPRETMKGIAGAEAIQEGDRRAVELVERDRILSWADASLSNDEDEENTTDEEEELFMPRSCDRSASSVEAASEAASDAGGSSGVPAQAAATSPHAPWTMNACAPEFIPTLTMACPLVGVCHVIPECQDTRLLEVPADTIWAYAFVSASALTAPPAAAAREAPPADQMQPQDPEMPPRRAPGHWLAARREKENSRRPPQLSLSDVIFNGSPTAKEIAPSITSTATAAVSRPPRSKGPGKFEMPEATEEEWQRRVETRRKAINIGKETVEYRRLAEVRLSKCNEDDAVAEPLTPDPFDRTVSKRQWKYNIKQWRLALKSLYLEECPGSVVSTEEGATNFDDDELSLTS